MSAGANNCEFFCIARSSFARPAEPTKEGGAGGGCREEIRSRSSGKWELRFAALPSLTCPASPVGPTCREVTDDPPCRSSFVARCSYFCRAACRPANSQSRCSARLQPARLCPSGRWPTARHCGSACPAARATGRGRRTGASTAGSGANCRSGTRGRSCRERRSGWWRAASCAGWSAARAGAAELDSACARP